LLSINILSKITANKKKYYCSNATRLTQRARATIFWLYCLFS
jgi:hypothetical protein